MSSVGDGALGRACLALEREADADEVGAEEVAGAEGGLFGDAGVAGDLDDDAFGCCVGAADAALLFFLALVEPD